MIKLIRTYEYTCDVCKKVLKMPKEERPEGWVKERVYIEANTITNLEICSSKCWEKQEKDSHKQKLKGNPFNKTK